MAWDPHQTTNGQHHFKICSLQLIQYILSHWSCELQILKVAGPRSRQLKRWSGLGLRHTQQNQKTPTSLGLRESGITHPKPARPLIRRYSELLDPTQLESQQVRSSSGNMFTGSTYNLREDRPLSVRERQERIEQVKEKVKKEQEMARGNRRKKDSAKISGRSASKETKQILRIKSKVSLNHSFEHPAKSMQVDRSGKTSKQGAPHF